MAAVDRAIYAPNPLVGDGAPDVGHWAQNEFQVLARTLQGVPRWQFSVLNRAPATPRSGMLAYADGTNWNPGSGEGLYVWKSDLAWHKVESSAAAIVGIEFVIDGGGVVITTGLKGYLEIPFACTINRATLLADRSGSIVVDIFKCTYAQFDAGSTHPVAGDKITASAPPTISSATKAQDSTLTGWTTAIAAGDILAFNVNSVTTCQRVTLSIKVTKT